MELCDMYNNFFDIQQIRMKIAIFLAVCLAGFLVVSISADAVCLQLSYLLHITELKLYLKFIGLHYKITCLPATFKTGSEQ